MAAKAKENNKLLLIYVDSLRNCFCGVVQLSNVYEKYTSYKRNYLLTQVKWKSQIFI